MRRVKIVYRDRRAETPVRNRGSRTVLRRPDFLELMDFTGPAVDVFERDSEFVVEIELPGVDENEVKVLVYPGRLDIRGMKKEVLPGEKLSFLRMEREFGPFQKEVLLPGEVDPDRAYAFMKNGVLTVILAKPGHGNRKAADKE